MDMKKKVCIIIAIFLIMCGYVGYKASQHKEIKYKIIDVIEADTYYIDLNRNNIKDEDELFKLKDIVAFKPVKNKVISKIIKKYNISETEALKNGYLAQDWAKNNLIGKYVKISKISPLDKNFSYRFATVELDNVDVAKMLLVNGLAVVRDDCRNVKYLTSDFFNQAKENVAGLSKIKFYALNLKTNIVHTLNSEHFSLINNLKLVLARDLGDYIPCKICFNKVHLTIKPEYNFPKSKGVYKKSIYKKFDNLELFLINPLEFSKPSNSCRTKLCSRLVEEINSSKTSIDVALYGIGDQEAIINALRNAKNRGVNIRSVVDYSKNMDKIYPVTRKFIEEFGAKTDKNEVLMHNKFLIFDNSKVFTGSINISNTGTGGYNANTAVIVKSNELANQYKTEFNQMYNSKFSNKKIKNPITSIVSPKFSIKAYFLPKHDVMADEIIPDVKNAKKEIFISIFYLTNIDLIDELVLAHNRGVEVLVMVDALSATNFKDRIMILRNKNIPVKVENWGGKNHEKTILIDGEKLIIGSANFSKNGFYKNDENVLAITSPTIAEFYRDYYLYLFNSIDNKYLHYFPRAESFESKNSCYDGIDNNFDGKIDAEDDGCK